MIFVPIGQSSDTQTEKTWIETKLKYDFKLHVWQKLDSETPQDPPYLSTSQAPFFGDPKKNFVPHVPEGEKLFLPKKTIVELDPIWY